MPIFDLTLESLTPIIRYEGAWSFDSRKNETGQQEDFRATQSKGATASFSFNGTGVFLYGSHSLGRGGHTVSINDSTNFPLPDSIDGSVLFSSSNLPYGEHQIKLTNTDAKNLLEFHHAMITTGDGDFDTPTNGSSWDSNAITYSNGWERTPLNKDVMVYLTERPNTNASLSFEGTGISVFGSTGPTHGAFSVSLDGVSSPVLNGSAPTRRPNTLLYRFEGLELREHTILVKNLGTPPFAGLEVDHVDVYYYRDLPGALPSTRTSSQGSSTSAQNSLGSSPTSIPDSTPITTSKKSHTGAIAGAVIGALLLLGLLGFGLWWCRRRRSRPTKTFQDAYHQDRYSRMVPPSASASTPVASAATPATNANVLTEHVDLPPPSYHQIIANQSAAPAAVRPLPSTAGIATSDDIPMIPRMGSKRFPLPSPVESQPELRY